MPKLLWRLKSIVMSQDKILQAKYFLERDEIVAIPTETVYGLAANALHTKAVVKIFEAKNRPFFDPLIVHTNSIQRSKQYIKHYPESALELAKKFWPGPLTLVLEKEFIIPDLVSAGLDTIGIRIPNHPITLELLSQLDFPLAAPSANPFGYVSPTSAKHVRDQLGDKIAYILEGGQSVIGIESTIIGFPKNKATVYRLGGLGIEEIEKVIGKVFVDVQESSKPMAAGMMDSHYAPLKPLYTFNGIGWRDLQIKMGLSTTDIGILAFHEPVPMIPLEHQLILAPKGGVTEAARNLFSYLRTLDSLKIKVIFAEFVDETGLGRAINDRLRRAAFKTKSFRT